MQGRTGPKLYQKNFLYIGSATLYITMFFLKKFHVKSPLLSVCYPLSFSSVFPSSPLFFTVLLL